MRRLKDYRKIVGESTLRKIEEDAADLDGKSITHVNSTSRGGGVAEILNSLVALFTDVGIHSDWRLLKGPPEFFMITKELHNALQGTKTNIGRKDKNLYQEINADNARITLLEGYDCVFVHDPQPLPLIRHYHRKQPWIWVCHADITSPFKPVWNYLRKFISGYDAMVVSSKKYLKKMPIPQYVIAPAIDPLSDKNKEMSRALVSRYLSKYGIPENKPIITQVSRFDYWKDPLGVVDAYRIVKKEIDCRLVLIGSFATDDPEGEGIYKSVLEESKHVDDIHIISTEDARFTNAIQRASSVIIQKSIREGFGLTVSEALWKGTPVIASNTGGITLQVIDGVNGYLINDTLECAKRIIQLLKNPKRAKRFGRAGKEHVRKNFLITRYLHDYILLLGRIVKNPELYKKGKSADISEKMFDVTLKTVLHLKD